MEEVDNRLPSLRPQYGRSKELAQKRSRICTSLDETGRFGDETAPAAAATLASGPCRLRSREAPPLPSPPLGSPPLGFPPLGLPLTPG